MVIKMFIRLSKRMNKMRISIKRKCKKVPNRSHREENNNNGTEK